jgi:hypothetical protein
MHCQLQLPGSSHHRRTGPCSGWCGRTGPSSGPTSPRLCLGGWPSSAEKGSR